MGQKVNQTIFRLGISNFNWTYKYLEKNTEESSLLLYKNTNIVDYITNIFNFYNILIHTCKLEYTKTSIDVIIYFFFFDFRKTDKLLSKKKLISNIITRLLPLSLKLYTKTNKIKIQTKDLNKILDNKLKNLRYVKTVRLLKKIVNKKSYNSYKSLIKILFITVCEKNSAKLLATCLAIYINKYRKKHGYLLIMLKKCLNILIHSSFSIVKGVKIEISGRINGAPRSKTKRVQIGSIPLQSFNSSIDYFNTTSYTLNGSFGVKVWVCEK